MAAGSEGAETAQAADTLLLLAKAEVPSRRAPAPAPALERAPARLGGASRPRPAGHVSRGRVAAAWRVGDVAGTWRGAARDAGPGCGTLTVLALSGAAVPRLKVRRPARCCPAAGRPWGGGFRREAGLGKVWPAAVAKWARRGGGGSGCTRCGSSEGGAGWQGLYEAGLPAEALHLLTQGPQVPAPARRRASV